MVSVTCVDAAATKLRHTRDQLLFVKWLLIIPRYLLVSFLNLGFLFAVFVTWWAILFTARYPRSTFDLVVGIQE